jgi:signal transduction histidine kinase
MITWSFTDQYFYCILTDDGIGFDIHNADKSRSGLRNMESRMREIKAGFELHSDDAGTMLRIEWPF